jgi:hypothetical protein
MRRLRNYSTIRIPHSALAARITLILLAAVLPACSSGPAPPKRGKLEGKVNVNSKPVAKGTILFMALTPGAPNVLANIQDGQYSVPAAEGPTKAKYRVHIMVPSGKKLVTDNPDIPGKKLEEDIELLPPRYNQNSELTLDYDPDHTESRDFNLTTP